MIAVLFVYIRVKISEASNQFSSSRFVQHLTCLKH